MENPHNGHAVGVDAVELAGECHRGPPVGLLPAQGAVRSLGDDLASGRWAERNRNLVDLEAAELGLRLLIA